MWTFDSQHKKLIILINDLSKQVSSSEKIGVGKTLNRFRNFVNHNFETEEEFMREIDYKYYDAHKAQHDQFLRDISSIEPEELSSEIITAWAAWWLCHTPFSDKPYEATYEADLKSVNWSD
jgi:hemerythrin